MGSKINKNSNRKKEEKYVDKDIVEFSNDLIEDSFPLLYNDNSFNIFKSINNISYLIYSNVEKSIIIYDLINNRKIIEIKNAHKEYITNIKHCFDKKNNRDLILSVSDSNNNIILRDFRNLECLFNIIIPRILEPYYIISVCFLNIKNDIYIVASNGSKQENNMPIIILDIKGNVIKKIYDRKNYRVFTVESYYDIKLDKNYIITANINDIKSYDFDKGELYHKYIESDNNASKLSIIIISNKDIIKLIESCIDGYIKIWNFHTGILKKIKVINDDLNDPSFSIGLYGICLWDNEHLFVGCGNKTIKLIDLKERIVLKTLYGHNEIVINIKKFSHPIIGECLISKGEEKDKIKIWTNKKIKNFKKFINSK